MVIAACVVLHNMAVKYRLPVPEHAQDQEEEMPGNRVEDRVNPDNGQVPARVQRENLVRAHFSDRR